MHSSLIPIVENLGRPRILVLGDLILDRYVWGDAERISQEAPVVLFRADKREERLGGAASVATMLAALGAEVTLAGVVGRDDGSLAVRSLLDQHGVDHELVLTDETRPTTVKERYIGRAQQKHPQQMMRVDYEVRESLTSSLGDHLVGEMEKRLAASDVVLISDYDKGVCSPSVNRRLIDACLARGVRVIADPIRGGDYASRYRGCSAITPNRLEAGLAAGVPITDVESGLCAAEKLRDDLALEAGIVTLDKEGMVLADRRGRRRHFPVRRREVYDITGAGDMVLAVLGMALAAGCDYPDAIVLANIAGGLEVERIGVATLTRAEILADLRRQEGGRANKVAAVEELAAELERRRAEGNRVVFTNGCFDLLHFGHVHYLREARDQGDLLVVGLNTDASVRRQNKGADRPINVEKDRAGMLAALECVDYICLFDEPTPLELIQRLRPDVLVKGADYRPDQVVGAEFVQSYGGRLHLAAVVPGHSTTATLSRIRAA